MTLLSPSSFFHPRSGRFLLSLWAVLLAVGFLPLRDTWAQAPRPIEWRVASSLCLVLLAWSTVRWYGERPFRRLTLGTAWGMTFGSLGDAWALPAEASLPIPRLLGAMILFGIGHLAYLWAFLFPNLIDKADHSQTRHQRISVTVGWWLVASLGWWLTASEVPQLQLRWPALGYAWMISLMGAVATWRAMSDSRWNWIAMGAVLFFISDFILAWQSFRGSFPLASDLCWLTYGPGQMLIVFGVRKVAGT